MQLEIKPLDNPQILLEINNSAVPYVNMLDSGKAQWLLEHATRSWLASLDGRAVGVLVLLNATCGLESEYYQWFTERYENFLYIDRVVVADWARGHGVATALYRAVDQVAVEGGYAIASEVYSQPPNTASLKFHQVMGYREVGSQYMLSEGKTVVKLLKYAERARLRV